MTPLAEQEILEKISKSEGDKQPDKLNENMGYD